MISHTVASKQVSGFSFVKEVPVYGLVSQLSSAIINFYNLYVSSYGLIFIEIIQFDPFCLHWSCSAQLFIRLEQSRGSNSNQANWIKLDLILIPIIIRFTDQEPTE